MHQNVVGSIPGQDAYLGHRFDPRWGASGMQPIDVSHVGVSLSLSLPLPLSLKAINISLGEDFKKEEEWCR